MKIIQLKSTITSPECGYSKEETMPEDACAFFHECEGMNETNLNSLNYSFVSLLCGINHTTYQKHGLQPLH